MLTFVIFIILIALIFDYVNGMHDAANSIATVVSTRVLSPMQAVTMAAVFNGISVILGTEVANKLGKGIIDPALINEVVIFAALIGAITWNLLTWWLGLPSSSSHALIGGLIGAGLASNGTKAILDASGHLRGGITSAFLFIVLSPALGLILGAITMICVFWIFRDFAVTQVDTLFRKLQIFSAAAYSFGHGSNDAQKTMGIIALVLFRYHLRSDPHAEFYVPAWTKIACNLFIALGTLSGGWRIVKTMGTKICKLQPVGGFCAESAGAVVLIGTALFGIPVSTTHTITGAIMGVGSTRRLSAVRWGVAQNIVVAWVLTIPAAAAVSMVTYWIAAPVASFLGV